MNGLVPRGNGHSAPGLEDFDVRHPHIANTHVRRHRPGFFEFIMRVDARPEQHMERAGEGMLMDGGCSVHPEQKLDVKARMMVNNNFRLAERRVGLRRMILVKQKITHQVGKIHALVRRPLLQCVAGDLGKFCKRKIVPFPLFQDGVPEFVEEFIHRRKIPCRSPLAFYSRMRSFNSTGATHRDRNHASTRLA